MLLFAGVSTLLPTRSYTATHAAGVRATQQCSVTNGNPLCRLCFTDIGERLLFMFNPWLDLSFKAFQLGLETQSVVALRMMRTRVWGRPRPNRGQAHGVRKGCSYC